jgi:hypothetical protein
MASRLTLLLQPQRQRQPAIPLPAHMHMLLLPPKCLSSWTHAFLATTKRGCTT